jgi:hypothetical protein
MTWSVWACARTADGPSAPSATVTAAKVATIDAFMVFSCDVG